ncbi:3-hydroxyacyl-CoA dehydrogenase NAD-binding domain-containing protein [Desertibacillus haloalkaliphilus]|uniref:3-hydroxyacyl-CoA dehydrogenase NAD-binding domain-containing protein n=1 Tax=Desertibacillus haloalkaliphilus TaxID=1328930 RepID=UPI001C25D896|nr:3-hydroxyacyl-CoA dehydrogenase NAD-binding domain-containing protein [Desertibacillus haloalkaliphilus]MBU8908925.1 3-hydroxybutyryl-CoA dehydrogenase [Desertibacillus haloalkaliphilus]
MSKVLVIGAGTMGSGIAQVIAQGNHDVTLFDQSEQQIEKGKAVIEKQLGSLVKKEKMSEEDKQATLNRITATSMKPTGVFDVIIEAVPENKEIKKAVFQDMESISDENTILATNTSSISISEIASYVEKSDQVIGLHFFNPPIVMQLVEVIRGQRTKDSIVTESKSFIESIGKVAVEVNEAPGFVVNRVLVPMINESIFLLGEGVASAEEIDKSMKLGANHPIGPLSLADLIGLDVCLHVMEVLYDEFSDSKYRPAPLLRKMVRSGYLGRKTQKGIFEYK